MKTINLLSRIVVIGALALLIVPWLFLERIAPGEVAVRRNAVSGVDETDLQPGWRLRVPGLHRIITLPSTYFFLDYTRDDDQPQEPLEIRTKDNNNVRVDVSVSVRIKPGEAHQLVEAGNHLVDGRVHRYRRLADQTAVSVLREELAKLDSVSFYTTQRRIEVVDEALKSLNRALADLHLEAQAVLVRAVTFRPEYERQLSRIQLNEQNKLLDHARERVASEQQAFDNYSQGTAALAAAREQEWIRRRAELERAYQVGLLDVTDTAPGATRRKLAALPEADATALRTRAAELFGLDAPASVTDAYLLGVQTISAETLEYKNRTTAEADAVAARLTAEGDALVAKVQGEFDTRLNALLNTPGGRAYVAWQAAENVHFDKKLTFSSSEGVPSVLRLRSFAEQFMGR